jgi:hypothetical protein
MPITYGGNIKEAPAGMLNNFKVGGGLPNGNFTISITDRNNQLREWPLNFTKLVGVYIFNGDVLRVDLPAVTTGTLAICDINNVVATDFAFSQTLVFNGTNQRSMKVVFGITGNSSSSTVTPTITRAAAADLL